VAVALIYPDIPCPACGGTHTLRRPRRRAGRAVAAVRYTCPATGVLVVLRPPGPPVPAAAVPPDAVPATPLPD
jgi:hypothetical protein